MTHPVLTALGLSDNESGTYLGRGEWSATRDAGAPLFAERSLFRD